MPFHRSFETSAGREAVLRALASVLDPREVQGDGELVRWSDGAARATIRLVPLGDRRLGGVALPRCRVEIVIDGCSEAEWAIFLDRFERAFLRGGG